MALAFSAAQVEVVPTIPEGRITSMKDILSALVFSFGLCIAFMAYAFVTGATTFTPQLWLLFGGLCIAFVVCIKLVRKAA
jgi:hypothetical protein